MSTEVKVSPYEEKEQDSTCDVATGTIGLVAEVAVSSVGFIAKSLILNEKEKQALLRLQEKERRERGRLKKLERFEIASVSLKLRNPETLVKSAINLGFKLNTQTKAPLQNQPRIVLVRPSGETLTIRKRETGGLAIETTKGNSSLINKVIEQHSIEQAINHLKGKCGSVKVEKGNNGEYVIVGQEKNRGQKDGAARITVRVSKNGITKMDVSNIKGRRCEEIINRLTGAIGGECIEIKKKSEYFQLPAEERDKVYV